MKQVILIFLVGMVVLSGCISGSQTEKVNADGSVHRLVSLDKTGILANASCNSLKNMAQNSPEADPSVLSRIDNVCRETDSELIIEYDLSPSEGGNPVKIIVKTDGKYLRYEDKRTPAGVSILTKVTMPSKVTTHNGELVDDYTVSFKSASTLNMGEDANTMNFVESKVPESDFSSIALIVGGLIVLGLVAKFTILSPKKKK
ncbi:MAG: hypothetical protein V1776_03810 [Candidatus Diapherotrites archaeon]